VKVSHETFLAGAGGGGARRITMNRRGFVGLVAGLLGALGLRGQEPPKDTGILKKDWPAYKLKHPDEECCPLGHSQKPRYFITKGRLDSNPQFKAGEVNTKDPPGGMRFDDWEPPVWYEHICSVCEVVYVPVEKKP
jgi:hypothetical protein